MRKTLVLVGPLAGKTMRIQGWPFVKGRLELSGPTAEFEGLIKYLKRWQAYPEDSLEYAAAQEGLVDGKLPVDEASGSGDSESVPGDGESIGNSPSEEPSNDGTGHAEDKPRHEKLSPKRAR